MDLVETEWVDVDWINLAQDREKRSALVNVITFGVHKMLGNYRVARQLVVSRIVLSFIELVKHHAVKTYETVEL
jgi:hypothetical protein